VNGNLYKIKKNEAIMEISLPELRKIAGNLLDLLNRESINATHDLDGQAKLVLPLGCDSRDLVSIEKRPSDFGTTTQTISYIRPGAGIPIELKINASLGYSMVIVKTAELVQCYEPFIRDSWGNVMQSKTMQTAGLPDLKKELSDLTMH